MPVRQAPDSELGSELGSGSDPGSDPGHADRRARLLDGAIAAIAARGYDAVRLRDVAAACGVTTGMVQHYFDSREELLVAAFERAAFRQVDSWRESARAEPDDARRLQVLLEQMLSEFGDLDTCVVWSELCASAVRHPDLQTVVRHVFDQWHRLLGDAVAAGVAHGALVPVMPVEQATALLVAAIDGFELALATGAGAVGSEAARAQVLRLADVLFPGRA
jgi:AcrR family transcriptional regulator